MQGSPEAPLINKIRGQRDALLGPGVEYDQDLCRSRPDLHQPTGTHPVWGEALVACCYLRPPSVSITEVPIAHHERAGRQGVAQEGRQDSERRDRAVGEAGVRLRSGSASGLPPGEVHDVRGGGVGDMEDSAPDVAQGRTLRRPRGRIQSGIGQRSHRAMERSGWTARPEAPRRRRDPRTVGGVASVRTPGPARRRGIFWRPRLAFERGRRCPRVKERR